MLVAAVAFLDEFPKCVTAKGLLRSDLFIFHIYCDTQEHPPPEEGKGFSLVSGKATSQP